MLLSIGMIVKNEEKYLEHCLTALKPILENVDSELIIADTGSTDNTVEIAKKFTDKVYYFEWINDFSAARNFTMEKSVGEWFMFLDADEIFQSCDEIIRFFNSGEYKSFATASYKIRSYTEENDYSKFVDTIAVRLSKRSPDVKFVNKIHEALSPIYQPIKMLGEIADHYGYFYTKDGVITEQAYIKSKRNLELLLESLNNPSIDFSVYKEIADCYSVINDNENALKYINLGLNTLDHKQIGIAQYFSEKAIYMYKNERFSELIDVCNQYFSERKYIHNKPIVTDIDMYAMRGAAYYFVGEYNKAVEDYIIFFRLYKDYLNGKLNTLDQIYHSLRINDMLLGKVYIRFLLSSIKIKKYSTALERLKDFPVEKFQSDREYMLHHFRLRAEIMDHTDWKSSQKFIGTLDDVNKVAFFGILRKKIFFTKAPEDVLKVLAEFKNFVPCAKDVIDIYCSYFINNDLQYEQIKKFTEKYGSDENVDILCIMLNCGMDISVFLTAADFNAEKCAHSFYADFADKSFLLEEYDVYTLSAEAVTNAASLFGWTMAEVLNSGKDITRIFEQNGKIAAKWVSEFPNEENIPADICAGIIVHGITEARKKKDYNTCINQMNMLINACPNFEPFVSEYRKGIEKEIMPQKDVRSEFAEMAETVKRNIRIMLDAGDISSAEKTLLELEKLCPADAEIGILKYDIKMHKNR